MRVDFRNWTGQGHTTEESDMAIEPVKRLGQYIEQVRVVRDHWSTLLKTDALIWFRGVANLDGVPLARTAPHPPGCPPVE